MSIILKVAGRYRLASIQEQVFTGGERQSVLPQVWEMYRESYKAIGAHVSSPTGLLEYDRWEVFFDEDRPVSFNLYKTTSFGLKTGLLGTDGSPVGKQTMKTHIKSRYKRPGVYGEVSHAVEKLTEGVPVVCVGFVPEVLKKAVVPQPDGVHYIRTLEGIGAVTKKLIGNPRGVPSGSESMCPIPENPGEALAPGEDLATKNASKVAAEIELAEHAACQLDFDS